MNFFNNLVIIFSSKESSMISKNLSRTQHDSRAKRKIKSISFDGINERTRVIQKNLVFANCLPPSIHNKETLKNNIYFGRYGKIAKMAINSGQSYRKTNNCHAYVTYQTELQASLAIVALDGFNLNDRPLKVSYGTTKYCSTFLKGGECKNPDCFYLHKLDEKREVQNGEFRQSFQEQNNEAFDIVCENLQQVVKRMMSEEEVEEGFPTFKEMIDFLIESNFVHKSKIEEIRKTVQKQKQEKKERKNEKRAQNKKEMDSSFSTIGSPSKQIQQKKQSNLMIEIKNNETKQQKARSESFNLEDKIEKMIIKKLLKGEKQYKSKLEFVKSDKTQVNDVLKLRKIIQKYLIPN